MKKSVIEAFLDLPGMLGLALIDKHSYWCVDGTNRLPSLQQSDIAIQGIQQIISTTPADLRSFDFWFSHENVRIYKLGNDRILLVLTNKELNFSHYQTAITEVQQALLTDTENAVGLLQTLSNRQASSSAQAPLKQSFPPVSSWRPSAPPRSHSEKLPTVSSAPSITSVPPLPSILRTTYDWETGIASLNALTNGTAKYLGPTVTANAWRATRPESPRLEKLQCDREGHFKYRFDAADSSDGIISIEEHELLEQWVQAFIKRCSLIIRDYPTTVLQQSLEDSQRAMLRIRTP
ncbi:MAG: hypothetical protein ACFBSF_15770 [Leptolyngbyaceae cyanobacterium]